MPENLSKLAKQVISNYAIKPYSRKLIQYGGIKTVWKLYDKSGLYCLKRLRHDPEKCLFSIEAQKFMFDKGANVPGIIENVFGKYFTEYKGQTFVLYNWLEGRHLKLKRKKNLKLLVKGLAGFHLASSGFHAEQGTLISTKLGRWPHQYSSMRDRLVRWKETARKEASKKLSQVYLENADYFIDLAEKAMELLKESDYMKWVREVEKRKTLCHQDYGESNALLTEKGIYVLDFDGVTYDLPVRDLRKIISKFMANREGWNEEVLRKVMRWYEAVNPLTAEQRRVLMIDLLFPHEFHNTAKNPFHKGKKISAKNLVLASAMDRQKVLLLEKLLLG